jgi:hypothetical protein
MIVSSGVSLGAKVHKKLGVVRGQKPPGASPEAPRKILKNRRLRAAFRNDQ